jgi:hypothetical protein
MAGVTLTAAARVVSEPATPILVPTAARQLARRASRMKELTLPIPNS